MKKTKIFLKNYFVGVASVFCTMICLLLFSIRTHAANTYYNPDAALDYASKHWDDGVGLCSEFVSKCINAGGCPSYSASCTALRKQLIDSGMAEEYVLTLNTDQSLSMTDYSDKIQQGDVVFYYCSGCINIDGKPYIHVVLCAGADSNGLMRAYSHNSANSGAKAYRYSSRCYACNTKISQVSVFHFKSESKCELNFGQGAYRVTPGNSVNVSVTFKGDGIYTLSGSTENSDICAYSWNGVDYQKGTANLTLTGKRAGSTTLKINLLDRNNNVLASNSVQINNEMPTASLTPSQKTVTLYPGDEAMVSFTWQGIKARALKKSTPNESVIKYKNNVVAGDHVQISYIGVGAGESSVTYTVEDVYGNSVSTSVMFVCRERKLVPSTEELVLEKGKSNKISIRWPDCTPKYLRCHYSQENAVKLTKQRIFEDASGAELEYLVTGEENTEFLVTYTVYNKDDEPIADCTVKFIVKGEETKPDINSAVKDNEEPPAIEEAGQPETKQEDKGRYEEPSSVVDEPQQVESVVGQDSGLTAETDAGRGNTFKKAYTAVKDFASQEVVREKLEKSLPDAIKKLGSWRR